MGWIAGFAVIVILLILLKVRRVRTAKQRLAKKAAKLHKRPRLIRIMGPLPGQRDGRHDLRWCKGCRREHEALATGSWHENRSPSRRKLW